MDLKQMQYFLCLAQEGNVTRAARQLNIVQPALSMQIAKLEKSLGKPLFYRVSRGMSLTPAGEALAQRIAPIMADIDRVRGEIAQLDGKVSGRVNIGMITSAAQSTLPASSATIAAKYPDIHLLVCEGYSETMLEWVATGQLDIAIVNTPAPRPTPNARHILDEEMMLAHGAGNKLPLPKVVSFDRLESLDIVIPSRRHGLRRILDDAAAEAGFSLKPRLEIDTLSAICEIVATTDLLTILPGIVLHSTLSTGRVRARRLRNPSIVRSVAWVTNPRRSVSAAMTAVMDIIAEDLTKAATSASRLVRR
ncbi:MAG: transcriptional regulator, LysR family [Bradyrhizobium sp.]|jgi:LysR family nitrogen assimilation transcriptional regulator|nr:transcriptional regulator, LysR family [Bradyrhizobium sp.]MEA2867504.1 LysR family transcriptional regulator, nitrogen assimilation regulatory protein [Bradyrhizobium sp.]